MNKLFRISPGYSINKETFKITLLILKDSLRVHIKGIPQHSTQIPHEMAKKILNENVHGNLMHAGQGHFRLMWISDFAMALKGTLKAIEKEKIKNIIQHAIDMSYKDGEVYSCFSGDKGNNLPYPRSDSLPWLLYCVNEYLNATRNTEFLKTNKDKLQTLLSNFENTHIENDGFIKKEFTGDWVDTIKRPSSTWNNILALYTYKIAPILGLHTSINHKEFEDKLVKERFSGDYLFDYNDSMLPSVDAAILAIYLEIFTLEKRKTLATWLRDNSDKLIKDIPPIKASMGSYPKRIVPIMTRLTSKDYHTKTHWMHLGIMYLNGLKKLELSYEKNLKKIEDLIRQHNNFIETFKDNGNPYKNIISSEYGFTMSAGQYLELIEN